LVFLLKQKPNKDTEMKLKASIFLLFLSLIQATQGHAQAPAAADVAAVETDADTPKEIAPVVPVIPSNYSVVNASADYSGVRLSYPVRVYAKVYDTGKIVCIPPNFPLRGLGLLTSNGVPVKLKADLATDPDFKEYGNCDDENQAGDAATMPKLTTVVGRALIIDEKTTKMYTPRSNGLTYGILVVPFKYYVNGSRDFKGAGTIGPYAGWTAQSSKWAAGLELVGFAGLSAVSSEKIVDGKATSETLAAFGYGVAVIGRIRNNFQVGIVAGQDRVGKSSQYKDNGKWWLALSVGYPFSN
jgi:hypothetical protein